MNRSEVQYLCEAKVGGYNRSTALFTPSNAASAVIYDPVLLYQQVTQMRLVSCHNPKGALLTENRYRIVPSTCSSRKPKRARWNFSGFSTCGECPQSSITSSRYLPPFWTYVSSTARI
jgi:hypothetical protein